MQSFGDIRAQAFAEVADVLDLLRSDFDPASPPTDAQAAAAAEARRLLRAAQAALDGAGRSG